MNRRRPHAFSKHASQTALAIAAALPLLCTSAARANDGEKTTTPPAPSDATPAESPPEAAGPPDAGLDPPLLSERDASSIGSLSVGHPHAGFLFNAVQMPKDPRWVLTVPKQAFGTEETVRNLMHVIGRVHEQFPKTPPVFIGSLSQERGGPLPPHKSHRTGRDVDVYFYYHPDTTPWYKPAGPHNLDRARTWALLRAIVTETDVDFVLIDEKVQALLKEYALELGEDEKWIADLFDGDGPYRPPLIKHIPGHTAHMHIRFVSAAARERGRLAYDGLVELGHLDPPAREAEHRVARGDTLIKIAKEHGTTVAQIRELNDLESTTIRVGQALKIRLKKDIRGARDKVTVPPRRLPGTPRKEDVATMAALLEVERQLSESFGKD